jgi:hypothetical protein
MTSGSATRKSGASNRAKSEDAKPVNSTSCVKIVKSPSVVSDRVTVSFAVINDATSAHLLMGSKQTILNFDGSPFFGTTFPSTPSASGSAEDDSVIKGSQDGQFRTSIHMAHTRSGGALTLTLWRNRMFVPAAKVFDVSVLLSVVFMALNSVSMSLG